MYRVSQVIIAHIINREPDRVQDQIGYVCSEADAIDAA